MNTSRITLWWRQCDIWKKAALLLWAAILLVITCRILIQPNRHTVYDVYMTAARSWATSAPVYRWPNPGGFRYSLTIAALMRPLTLLPDRLGWIIWLFLNAAAFLLPLAWCCRIGLPRPMARKQWSLIFLLVIPLSIGSLNNGQANPLIIGCLLASVAASAQQRWTLAALCAAIPCWFKFYPVALGLLLATLFPKRFASHFLLILILGLIFPFLLRPADYVLGEYHHLFGYLTTDDRTILPVRSWYQDLRLLCRPWGLTLRPTNYLAIQLTAAASIAAVVLGGSLARWPRRLLLTRTLALTCIWMTLVGPATEACTYMFLAPSLAWALWEAWLTRSSPLSRSLISTALALVLISNMALWFPFGRQFLTFGTLPLSALLLWIDLLIRSATHPPLHPIPSRLPCQEPRAKQLLHAEASIRQHLAKH